MHSSQLNNNSRYQDNPPLDPHFWGSPERKLPEVVGEGLVVQGKSRPVEAWHPVELRRVRTGPKQVGSPVQAGHILDSETADSAGTVCTAGAARSKSDDSL